VTEPRPKPARRNRQLSALTLAFAFLSTACDRSTPPSSTATANVVVPASHSSQTNPTTASNPSPGGVPTYSYKVLNVFPHDTNAFTQGLVFLDGALFESTGLNGHSTLRKVDLKTGQVLKQAEVPPQYFAEGIAVLNGKIFQLTWQDGKAFVYDLDTFHLEKRFAYDGEGWGLTTDGQSLVLSDGTDQLRFLDPATFDVKRTISVTLNSRPVKNLNELEYVKGEIFANVWQTFNVVRIDPATGKVLGVINFAGLLKPADFSPHLDVMNGIAYDAAADRLFVTGKHWPKLFEVHLKP
jgi:glutamine cyclotransferase